MNDECAVSKWLHLLNIRSLWLLICSLVKWYAFLTEAYFTVLKLLLLVKDVCSQLQDLIDKCQLMLGNTLDFYLLKYRYACVWIKFHLIHSSLCYLSSESPSSSGACGGYANHHRTGMLATYIRVLVKFVMSLHLRYSIIFDLTIST